MSEQRVTEFEFCAAASFLAQNISLSDGLAVTVMLKYMAQSSAEKDAIIADLRQQLAATQGAVSHYQGLLGQRRMRIMDLEAEIERLEGRA